MYPKIFDPLHKVRIPLFKKNIQILMSLNSERFKPDAKPLDIYCFNSKGPVDSNFSTQNSTMLYSSFFPGSDSFILLH